MKLHILYVGEYKEYPYIVQMLHTDNNKYVFQYMVHKPDEGWFQGHNIITAVDGVSELTQDEIVQSTVLTKDFAMTTIETLIKKKNPNYEPTQDEKFGQDVINAVESMDKMNQKRIKKQSKK